MNWTHIMIHHSATPDDGQSLQFRGILDYHINVNAWSDVGYHFLCERVGNKPVIIVGRGLNKPGAHCPGMNHRAIGICFVGDYENTPIDDDLISEGLQRVIIPLCKTFHIKPENIIAHRDCKATLCPGKNMYELMPNIRNKVALRLGKNFV